MAAKKYLRVLFIFIGFIVFFCLSAYFLLGTTKGSAFIFSRLINYYAKCDFSYGRAEGNLLKQLTFYDVRVNGFKKFSKGYFLTIQKIDVYFNTPAVKDFSFEVHNGQFFLPSSGPIVFNGIYQDRGLDFRFFFQSLDLNDVVPLFTRNKDYGKILGVLSYGNIVVRSSVAHPRVFGEAILKDTSKTQKLVFSGDSIDASLELCLQSRVL